MAFLTLTLFIAGCSDNTPPPVKDRTGNKMVVCSTIGPIAFIAGEIGGDKIISNSLIPQADRLADPSGRHCRKDRRRTSEPKSPGAGR